MARNDTNTEKDFLDIDLDDSGEVATDGLLAEELSRPAPAMSLGDGVLLFDNKRYAVGLSWLIAEDESDVELAIKRAKAYKADFYCMRQSVVTQHGFGFLAKGHRLGLSALASMAADIMVGEWHGVFVADNGWWYVAVHADNIAPDGDILFTSEEDAYNHYLKQAEAYRWPRSYAPAGWNIPDTAGEIALSKITEQAQPLALKPVTLDAIFSGARNKQLAIGAVLAIIGLVTLSLAGQTFLPSLVPMQAQVPAPNINVEDVLSAPPKELLPTTATQAGGLLDVKLPIASAVLENCLQGFSVLTISLPGWSLDKLNCRDRTIVEATWLHKTGSYAMVEPYLNKFTQGTNKTFLNSGTLVANRRITDPQIFMNKRDLLNRNYAIITLTRRLASLGGLDIKEVVPGAVDALLQGVEIMQRADFSVMNSNKPDIQPLTQDDLPYLQITLNSKMPPNIIGKHFDIFGLSMQTVSSELPKGEWKYQAKLILQPEMRILEANDKAIEYQNQQK